MVKPKKKPNMLELNSDYRHTIEKGPRNIAIPSDNPRFVRNKNTGRVRVIQNNKNTENFIKTQNLEDAAKLKGSLRKANIKKKKK